MSIHVMRASCGHNSLQTTREQLKGMAIEELPYSRGICANVHAALTRTFEYPSMVGFEDALHNAMDIRFEGRVNHHRR